VKFETLSVLGFLCPEEGICTFEAWTEHLYSLIRVLEIYPAAVIEVECSRASGSATSGIADAKTRLHCPPNFDLFSAQCWLDSMFSQNRQIQELHTLGYVQLKFKN